MADEETPEVKYALKQVYRDPQTRKAYIYFVDADTGVILTSLDGYTLWEGGTETGDPTGDGGDEDPTDNGTTQAPTATGNITPDGGDRGYDKAYPGDARDKGPVPGVAIPGADGLFVSSDGIIQARERTAANNYGYISPGLLKGGAVLATGAINPVFGLITLGAINANNLAAVNAARKEQGLEPITGKEALRAIAVGVEKVVPEEEITSLSTARDKINTPADSVPADLDPSVNNDLDQAYIDGVYGDTNKEPFSRYTGEGYSALSPSMTNQFTGDLNDPAPQAYGSFIPSEDQWRSIKPYSTDNMEDAYKDMNQAYKDAVGTSFKENVFMPDSKTLTQVSPNSVAGISTLTNPERLQDQRPSFAWSPPVNASSPKGAITSYDQTTATAPEIYATALALGWDPKAAAVQTANFAYENGATAHKGVFDGARQSYVNTDGTRERSFGLGQWNEKAGRFQELQAFAEQKGVPWQSVRLQMEFFAHEVKTNPAYAPTLKALEDPNITMTQANKVFVDNYERPAAKHSAYDQRLTLAEQYSKEFGNPLATGPQVTAVNPQTIEPVWDDPFSSAYNSKTRPTPAPALPNTGLFASSVNPLGLNNSLSMFGGVPSTVAELNNLLGLDSQIQYTPPATPQLAAEPIMANPFAPRVVNSIPITEVPPVGIPRTMETSPRAVPPSLPLGTFMPPNDGIFGKTVGPHVTMNMLGAQPVVGAMPSDNLMNSSRLKDDYFADESASNLTNFNNLNSPFPDDPRYDETYDSLSKMGINSGSLKDSVNGFMNDFYFNDAIANSYMNYPDYTGFSFVGDPADRLMDRLDRISLPERSWQARLDSLFSSPKGLNKISESARKGFLDDYGTKFTQSLVQQEIANRVNDAIRGIGLNSPYAGTGTAGGSGIGSPGIGDIGGAGVGGIGGVYGGGDNYGGLGGIGGIGVGPAGGDRGDSGIGGASVGGGTVGGTSPGGGIGGAGRGAGSVGGGNTSSGGFGGGVFGGDQALL